MKTEKNNKEIQPCYECCCCIVYPPEGALQLPRWQYVFGMPTVTQSRKEREQVNQCTWEILLKAVICVKENKYQPTYFSTLVSALNSRVSVELEKRVTLWHWLDFFSISNVDRTEVRFRKSSEVTRIQLPASLLMCRSTFLLTYFPTFGKIGSHYGCPFSAWGPKEKWKRLFGD